VAACSTVTHTRRQPPPTPPGVRWRQVISAPACSVGPGNTQAYTHIPATYTHPISYTGGLIMLVNGWLYALLEPPTYPGPPLSPREHPLATCGRVHSSYAISIHIRVTTTYIHTAAARALAHTAPPSWAGLRPHRLSRLGDGERQLPGWPRPAPLLTCLRYAIHRAHNVDP
jgi:hypothetical protein